MACTSRHAWVCIFALTLAATGCGGDNSATGPMAGEPATLPADPGEVGKATVAGIDSDADGVRDDIQRHIATTQPASPPTRAALRQHARAQQRLLLDAHDREKSYSNAIALGHAIDCVFFVRSRLGRSDHARLVNELRAEFLNTQARTAAYFQADAQLGGRYFPGDFENLQSHCEFDTTDLPTVPPAPGGDGSEED